MRLSPLDLQWVLNSEFLPLAAMTLVAGALGDRFGQKRIFLAGIALFGLGRARLFDSRARRAGRGADEPFRSEPLGARHPDHRSGRLTRPDRNRTAWAITPCCPVPPRF